jgi:TRAP-type uncharacterized transport system fused permease subunit
MGLPATAAYIVLAVMTGPALQELGLALITAHMIIFWLSQSSNVTPPIALAAFAGAGIAGAAPMRSAVEAFKLANGLFVIPLMMAYSPLLLTSEFGWAPVLGAAVVTMTMIVAVAVCVEGYLFTHVANVSRWASLLVAGLLVYPNDVSHYTGLFLALMVFAKNYFDSRRQTAS